MSPIVADRPRHTFPLKSFFVGVVVMFGKVETSSSLSIIQIVCHNFTRFHISRFVDVTDRELT